MNDSPGLSSDLRMQIKLLENPYHELFKNTWAMNEYMKRLLAGGLTLTTAATKRKKLAEQVVLVQRAWAAMVYTWIFHNVLAKYC